MIRVDEDDPVGELELSFSYRNVRIQRDVDPKKFYDLTTEIGRGKFGTVYKCLEKGTGLKLAAKFVGVPKKEDRRNVEREVDIMRSLQHPRLLQIYDAFENEKVMCVILELIEGGELFERVIDDDFVLTEKSCTVFMRQICEGVSFIHKQKILHLDMKPENILCLTKTGNRIKIIDFGLARKYDPSKKLQVLFGTPEFVAPEIVNFDEIGYGTDMWSVGVICYVLLSGLSPFMGASDVETMANVTIGKYDFDDEAFKEISENAKDFIKNLLLKDITARLTAEECLKHKWLLRRTLPEFTSMEVTKDNLKQFVERWNDHPNSPYIFEIPTHIITPCNGQLKLSASTHSLEGMSPSPCGSLASSIDSDETFRSISMEDSDSLTVPQADHIRRASDSTCIIKGSDVSDRLNLADEIRKLTDKLFQLSTMPDFNTNPASSKSQNMTVGRPSNLNGVISNGVSPIPNIQVTNSNGDVPWRRQKFKIANSSRDVPLAAKSPTVNSFEKQLQQHFPTLKSTSKKDEDTPSIVGKNGSVESTANGTKNMLLKLLEQWEGPQTSSRHNTRHFSVSSEWSESDSLGQRTISSLNMFFQTRTNSKKLNQFVKSNGVN